MNLSANDIRATSWGLHICGPDCNWVHDIRVISWGLHTYFPDRNWAHRRMCIFPKTSDSAIVAMREQRREERKKRREAQRKKQEEERKRKEEAAAKIVTGRLALVQKMGAATVQTAQENLKRFFKEDPSIKKQQAQMEKAFKSLSAPQGTEQTHTQEYMRAPYLHDADHGLA